MSQECREGFQHGAVLNVESKIQNIFKHADSQMKEPLCSQKSSGQEDRLAGPQFLPLTYYLFLISGIVSVGM